MNKKPKAILTIKDNREYLRRDHQSTKIKKDDTVKVIAGNDKGKIGKVLSSTGVSVVVQGVNVRKRHMKGQGQQQGRIIEIEKPIHISNVRVCPAQEPVRLRVKEDEKGNRHLIYANGEEEVFYRALNKPK
jgi:large subunit ribosomal protein L24